MNLRDRTITLNISSWAGVSMGAQHYYGELKFYDEDGEMQCVKLERRLTKMTAEILNEQRNRGRSKDCQFQYEPGEKTECFNDEKHVRRFALSKWKQFCPHGLILLEGSFACGDPQRCLSAFDPDIKKGLNMLVKKAEDIGWYEGDYDAMCKVSSIHEEFLNKCEKIAEEN
jgi:hypothetical protein